MRFQELIARLRDSIAGGAASQNLVVALVGFAVLLLVLAGIAYVAYLMSPRGRLQALLQQRSSSQRRTNWALRLGALAVVVFALLSANWYTGRPATCASCHTDGKQAKSLQLSPHKDVSCSKCHMVPGPTGAVRQGFTYARWVYVYGVTKKVPDPKSGSVSSGACLRCHSNVKSGTLTSNGIRVRHSDFLSEGAKCADCHNSTAHPNAVSSPSKPGMSACLSCHDGKKARSECSVCHVTDVAATPSQTRGYDKVKTTGRPGFCYDCHDPAPCTTCHGIQMPHPTEWGPAEDRLGGSHARAGFTQRELCWRCHSAPGKPLQPDAAGCSCHGLFGPMHGGTAWVKEHGLEATGKKPGSNARCFDCHSETLCDVCHPASYRSRYNPIVGSDNYQRLVPQNKLDNQW